MAVTKHPARGKFSKCSRCHTDGLRWGHDTTKTGRHCSKCKTDNGFSLIDPGTGELHVCGEHTTISEEILDDPLLDTPDPTPKDETPVTTAPDTDAALAALRALIAPTSPALRREDIEDIVVDVLAELGPQPTRTVVIKEQETRPIEGDTHRQLGDVIMALGAGEHVLMVGPAGTGKSTIAEQAAEALSLRSFSISLSPQTPASQLLGYMQATGDYVCTLFREAYENGGVFHFDEMDNAHPSVLAVINSALANGHMAFPDQMVKRHDDFRCVASANTYGRGATRAYVGRQAIDGATLDRFTVLTIEIDDALEKALCYATGLDISKAGRALTAVRDYRNVASDLGLNVIISPRASVGMCRLLRAGMSWNDAVDARIRRGLDDVTWRKLQDGVKNA